MYKLQTDQYNWKVRYLGDQALYECTCIYLLVKKINISVVITFGSDCGNLSNRDVAQ